MKLHRFFIALGLAAMMCIPSYAQMTNQDWAGTGRFADATQVLKNRNFPKIVLIGDSISDFWIRKSSGFFYDNGIICRGISGQTTSQMLLRFRREVIESGASTVVILAGTNDIAGNTGPISLEDIAGNIKSMCELALQAGIRPVICSVLPAHQYYWSKDKHPDIDIPKLNRMLKEYVARTGISYVDFYSAMVDNDKANENGLPEKYSADGVHPKVQGYAVMENMLLKELKEETEIYRSGKSELKLMSFNVRNGKGMDLVTDMKRPAAIISDLAPDVVAIQEVDSVTNRASGKYMLGELAGITGMIPLFSAAIEYDGGKYGIGMLCRQKPMSIQRIALPGREEQRTLLIAEFKDYFFCSTHLSLTEEDRLASVDIISSAFHKLEKKGKPIFIAGDWNDEPDSRFISMMRKHFTFISDIAKYTFPSDKPDRTIDYIAFWKRNGTGELRPAANGALNSTLSSDHRPIYCELK